MYPPIGVDSETALFRPGCMAPRPVCLSFAGCGGENFLVRHDECEPLLRRLLQDKHPLCIANAPYDMCVAGQAWPDLLPLIFEAYEREIIWDPQIRQKLIDIAAGEYRQHGGYRLADLAKRFWGITVAKGEDTWRLRYDELHDVPLEDWPEDAKRYALYDAELHRDTCLYQQKRLESIGRLDILQDEPAQNRAHFALTLVSNWGIRTDPEAVARLRETTQKDMDGLRSELERAGLLVGGKRKVRAAQKRMCEIVPWDAAKLTKKGRETKERQGAWQQIKYLAVDEEACLDSEDALLKKYAEYASLGSFLSGHCTALLAPIIHTRFEPLLETGRTSSSGPNIQNVRRKPGARECFVPREGCCFVGCDYDKAELHTLAQVCLTLFGHSRLADALNSGYDPHLGLGATLAGVTYEEAKSCPGQYKEWRQRAKPANFGFPGGMGPRGMQRYAKAAYQMILTLEECEHLYSGWRSQWPEVSVEYLGWIRSLCEPEGAANIKHFVSGRSRGRVPYCTAANSFFQGMAADGMKRALFAVQKECYVQKDSPLHGCRVVNEIHDEFLLEARLGAADAAAWRMRDVMVREFNHFTKDVPVRATPCIMDRWSKKAETLLAGGKLQLWRYTDSK